MPKIHVPDHVAQAIEAEAKEKKTATKKVAKKKVYAKILGQEVLVGSKKWETLTYQVKLFNQLNKSENL